MARKWGLKAFMDGISDLYKTYIKFEHAEIGKYNMGQKILHGSLSYLCLS